MKKISITDDNYRNSSYNKYINKKLFYEVTYNAISDSFRCFCTSRTSVP